MKTPLKQTVQEHLESRSLSEEQFAELEALQASVLAENSEENEVQPEAEPSPSIFGKRPWLPAALAAALMLVALVPFLWPGKSADMPSMIAEEVVKNHLNLKPLEVKGSELATISRYFNRLDFVPRQSEVLAGLDVDLLGGRYCSLQGVTAAQLRLQDGGKLRSLYQVPYKPEIFTDLPRLEEGEAPKEAYARGVRVKMWVEKGILFAVTAD